MREVVTEIKSSETVFAIIDRLRRTREMGVTELETNSASRRVTLQRHLSTMREASYVVKNVNGTYSIGLKFFSIGYDARNRCPLY